MLNPRAYPFHQETDRLKVGDCIVDIPRREMAGPAHAEPTRITVKALHVLLALVGQHGKVVSREALLEWVWPDTLPTDDVLTQAIGQLRKAFADDRESPRYLETISKGGYRLIAPVEWLDEDTSPGVVADTASATPAPREAEAGPDPGQSVPPDAVALAGGPRARIAAGSRVAWGAALAVAALVAAFAFWRMGAVTTAASVAPVATATPAPANRLAFVTITSKPGREANPNLSPDGAMVAYEQMDAKGYGVIMLQATLHVPGRPLTQPPDGHSDSMPVWSHDGRRLAFVRYSPDSRCEVMVIAASGGNERKIADCFSGSASTYDWTPDDSGLLMGVTTKPASEKSSPLRLLDLGSGQWRTLGYAIAEGDIDIDPRYSPDGRWIVFRRSISLSDLWKMPAAGGKPQRLTNVKGDIRGWDFTPDGRAIIFSYIGNEVGLFRYDMGNGKVTPLPADEILVSPDIARASPSMVFTVDQSTSGIFRYTLPTSPEGKVNKQRVFPSSRSDMLPAVSPDGRLLAFMSDRGSRFELWVGELARPDSARPIETLMPVPRHIPVWSEDGTRLLVVGNQTGQQALYEIEVESGRMHLLPVPATSPIYAAYTERPDRIIVGSDGGNGRLRAVLYDRSKIPWRELASLPDVALVRFNAATRKVYFTRVIKPGTWQADTGLQSVQVLDADRPHSPKEYKRWDVSADGAYFMEWSEGCPVGWIRLGAPATRSPLCLDSGTEAWALGPSLERSGRSVFVTMDLSNNADIGWADLSPQPAAVPIAQSPKQ
ncbi:MAG: winged helix-turn-helix domain-containing protein [Pseudoxanthomonas sp.]